MIILITGGCGYLGSKLIRELGKKYPDSTIRILDNMMREKHVALWDLPKGPTYQMIEGDIRNDSDLEKAIKDVDVVLSLSDLTNAPKSFENKELTEDINFRGVMKILDACEKHNVKKFIYSSTASVYGTTSGIVDETFDCKPISPYGINKLRVEKEILKRAKEKNLNYTALRLGTVVGWTIGMRFDTVIDRFTYLACIGMPITVWESAIKEARPYTHVKDIMGAYLFAIENAEKMKGEAYNIVAENKALGEVVDLLKENFPDLQSEITKQENLNQVSYKLSSEKIKSIGFEFKHTINQGILDIIEKFKGIKPYTG